MNKLLYHLLNKPWEWRQALADYRARRDEQWELVDFWHGLRKRTCRACLRERGPECMGADRICTPCWSLATSSRPLSVPEQIRVNRILFLEGENARQAAV